MKVLYVCLIVILSCCGRVTKNSGDVIDLLAPAAGEITNLSVVATDVDYIPFQTTNNSLIRQIYLFKARKNYLYIGTLNEVFCFNDTGEYLYKLDKNGKGPEEYEFLQDFDINFDNTILAVLSRSKIILYKQTNRGFTYMGNLPLSIPASPTSKINFADEQNNLFVLYSNQEGNKSYSRVLINMKGEALIVWPNYMKFLLKGFVVTNFLGENISYWSDNTLYFKLLQNDTLFKFSKKTGTEPFIVLDTKEKRLTPEARSDGNYYNLHMDEYIHVQRIMGSKKYLYFSYYYNKIYCYIFYDLIFKSKFNVPDKFFLKDDISGGINFEPKYCNEGSFYSWIDAFKLKEFVLADAFENSKVLKPEKKENLKELVDKLSENDNPVLIIAKIK